MKHPQTIEEFLDERISFCETCIDGSLNENQSNFEKALVNFKDLKNMLHSIRSGDDQSIITKSRFKNNLMNELSLIYEASKKQAEGYAPASVKYYAEDLQKSLEIILKELDSIYSLIKK